MRVHPGYPRYADGSALPLLRYACAVAVLVAHGAIAGGLLLGQPAEVGAQASSPLMVSFIDSAEAAVPEAPLVKPLPSGARTG